MDLYRGALAKIDDLNNLEPSQVDLGELVEMNESPLNFKYMGKILLASPSYEYAQKIAMFRLMMGLINDTTKDELLAGQLVPVVYFMKPEIEQVYSIKDDENGHLVPASEAEEIGNECAVQDCGMYIPRFIHPLSTVNLIFNVSRPLSSWSPSLHLLFYNVPKYIEELPGYKKAISYKKDNQITIDYYKAKDITLLEFARLLTQGEHTQSADAVDWLTRMLYADTGIGGIDKRLFTCDTLAVNETTIDMSRQIIQTAIQNSETAIRDAGDIGTNVSLIWEAMGAAWDKTFMWLSNLCCNDKTTFEQINIYENLKTLEFEDLKKIVDANKPVFKQMHESHIF